MKLEPYYLIKFKIISFNTIQIFIILLDSKAYLLIIFKIIFFNEVQIKKYYLIKLKIMFLMKLKLHLLMILKIICFDRIQDHIF